MIVRELPARSRLVTALNGGREAWTLTHDLLADIWVVLVRANSPKGSLPEDFDHPIRAARAVQAKATHIQGLKVRYFRRKQSRRTS